MVDNDTIPEASTNAKKIFNAETQGIISLRL
jgi:hypothetical protein